MSEGSGIARGEVVVYEENDEPRVEVILGEDTVWLSLNQIADVFGRDKSVISRHLKTIFDSGELKREATVAENATVQAEGTREVQRTVTFYNLDAILAVGYRVNSRRGTQFRRWATDVLRQHLVDGITINQKRLEQRGREAERALAVALETLRSHQLISGDGQEVLAVVQHYFKSWELLRAYDEDTLPAAPGGTTTPLRPLTLEAAREAIRTLADDMAARGEALGLFGQERGDALESILDQLEQSAFGQPAYPTVESRAAHLLYFVIKNHPLSDGNKRVASLLFLDYLRLNGAFLASDGRPRFSDTALVALALLVATSDPKDKDIIIKLILNLLAEDRP